MEFFMKKRIVSIIFALSIMGICRAASIEQSADSIAKLIGGSISSGYALQVLKRANKVRPARAIALISTAAASGAWLLTSAVNELSRSAKEMELQQRVEGLTQAVRSLVK